MEAEATAPATATPSGESYIGSLISLTSKSEIRYEGILYSINTLESSIALRNVRSFGTEGRKKDGPQVAPSDKVYEYILFRGSDIKDLQVKSSPPAQPVASTSSIDNDPAIIQSHYPRPTSASTNLPPAVGASPADTNPHAPQLGHPGSSFPGALPLYQPGGNLGSWGPSPPPGANGTGLTIPMYWPGFYGPPNGLPHAPQQTLLRPPPGLSMLPIPQLMQYPGFNLNLTTGTPNLAGSKLPDIPPSLVSSSTTSTTLPPTSVPQLNLPSVPSISAATETSSSSTVSKAPSSGLLSMPSFPSMSPLGISAPDAIIIAPVISNKVNAISSSSLPSLSLSQTTPIINSSSASQTDNVKPSLVTPDQLVQSGQIPISSAPSAQIPHNDVEVVQSSSASLSDAKTEVVNEAQPPLLPLPPASRAFHKPIGTQSHPAQNHNYRGRGRGRGKGRGIGSSHAVTKFSEDFDFMAMNEKFNKDEVWGHLGKSNKDKDGNGGDDSEEDGEEELPQLDAKPVYNKDDFFDSLSCNTLDNDSQNGRTRFSEQLKLDTETFGDFVRYRGGRGVWGRGRGGRGGRGGSYYGRGYGYPGRGRGRGMSTRNS